MKQASKTLTLKERQREERIALILQAAHDVLVEKGYHEASMDEIAARVGISKGTLYLHFGSKEDLVFMLIQEEASKFLSLIDEIIHEELSVRERLEAVLLETYKGIQQGRQFLLALRSLGLSNSTITERLEEQDVVKRLMDRLTSLFEEGKANGEFDPNVPTAIMISIFLGLMRMHDNDQLVKTNELSPEDLVASASRVFFHGLLAQDV